MVGSQSQSFLHEPPKTARKPGQQSLNDSFSSVNSGQRHSFRGTMTERKTLNQSVYQEEKIQRAMKNATGAFTQRRGNSFDKGLSQATQSRLTKRRPSQKDQPVVSNKLADKKEEKPEKFVRKVSESSIKPVDVTPYHLTAGFSQNSLSSLREKYLQEAKTKIAAKAEEVKKGSEDPKE